MFKFRKTPQELAILRRLRLLARGDPVNALRDADDFRSTKVWDSSAAFRGANILLGAHLDRGMQVSHWDHPGLFESRQALLGLSLSGCAFNSAVSASVPGPVTAESTGLAHVSEATVAMYQVHARDAAQNLCFVGFGTKLVVAVGVGAGLLLWVNK